MSRKVIKWIIRILIGLLLLLFLLLGYASEWYAHTFGGNTINDIIFTLKAPIEGTDSEMIVSFLTEALAPCIVTFIFCVGIMVWLPKLYLEFGKHHIRLFPQLLAVLLFAPPLYTNIVNAAEEIQLVDYIRYMSDTTNLYEEYYTDPASVTLTFPEAKRNLVYIVMESMETTYTSHEYGGAYEVNLIPNLTEIAEENVSFSENDQLVGAQILNGTGFTVGSLVAQTSGVPLTIPIDGNGYSGYGQFLPGIYTLGDILENQGYHQVFMIGSKAKFGGRKDYFTYHGDYEIMDYNYAIKNGDIPEDYKVWWGYEDQKLYQFAKEELTELASDDTPFNFTMLTVDTHHIGGYVCNLCGDEYEEQYSNVIVCADCQIAEFIEWLQQQEFYENTTVVIVGDHPSMDPEYFTNLPEGYRRATYNVFLNSAAEASKEKNRVFSTLDMYPTTLAALGVEIEGEQMGLGVNLFSGKETLLEQLGTDYVGTELQKNSEYYNNVLLYSKG